MSTLAQVRARRAAAVQLAYTAHVHTPMRHKRVRSTICVDCGALLAHERKPVCAEPECVKAGEIATVRDHYGDWPAPSMPDVLWERTFYTYWCAQHAPHCGCGAVAVTSMQLRSWDTPEWFCGPCS